MIRQVHPGEDCGPIGPEQSPPPPSLAALALARPAPYYEAGAVLGVELDLAKLIQKTRQRGCLCVEWPVDNGWRFCPACGCPMWVERLEPIAAFQAGDLDHMSVAGLPVITTSAPFRTTVVATVNAPSWAALADGRRLFTGLWVARTDMARPAVRVPLEPCRVRAELRERLEPVGLWCADSFGLWAVLKRVS